MPKRQKTEEALQDEAKRVLSFTDALYAEMDKLSKKAPSAEVSDLALKRVNRAITSAKALLDSEDEFVAEIELFVPAGNNPEVRDALLVLGEIRSGIERLQQRHNFSRWY